jgi:hypothetical protein
VNRRHFALPVVSALGLSLTAACSDPLVGEWEASRISAGGASEDLPFTYSYTYNSQDYTVTTSFHLSVERGFAGTFTTLYTKAASGGVSTPYQYDFGLIATRTDKGAYDISVTGLLGLSCTLARKVLTCDDTDPSSDLQFEFGKQ